MLILFIYAAIAVSIILLIWGMFYSPQFGAKHIPLPSEEGEKPKKIQRIISNIFPFSQNLLEKLKLDTKLKARLDAAHIKLTPAAFFNFKILLMISLALLVFTVSGKLDTLSMSLPIIFGYVAPDIWLNIKIARRREAIMYLLPETVDLIGLCIEAGLDFTAALKWIIEKTPLNPMVEEFSLLLEEIKWGKTRSQALKDMAKRLNILELISFVQTLVQAERMGTPVAEAFRVISEDTRAMRFQRAERIALKAPLKILLPLVFLILPVIAIIVGGPLLLQFFQADLLKGFVR